MMTKLYSFKKTLEKVGIAILEIAFAGTLAYATDHPGFLFLVPIVEGVRNWIKHRNK